MTSEGEAQTPSGGGRNAVAAVIIVALVVLVGGVALVRSIDDGSSTGGDAVATVATPDPDASAAPGAPKVTFVELGSVGCAPCDAMAKVMPEVEKAFGEQVKVIFYDVRKDSAPAQQYGIQYIPTQVFLDADGKEFHRHTGFYPYEDIEALLLDRGLTLVASPAAP